jgi:predicted Zn-dependent protease
VRVWEDRVEIPTYEEGAPDVNPPFDVFQTRRFNYPYTLRENLTETRAPRTWRTLNLENEYLKVVVLPDLGGHLYSCVDKSNGADLFYANGSIKKARVAYRGAWTALGIEFNFPVSHNWVTASPVDFALARQPDGGATIWVGNVDRVYGMRWRVGLTLRPGRAVLEQDVVLSNPGAARHRFYWWNNAGVRVWDDSRIEYPMRFTASHGFRSVDTWPVNQAGVDLQTVGNHRFGPVSEFSHGSREPFMGVYHPKTRAGVVHYSSPLDAPTKKIWSWGSDADGLDWRKALSDDESAYVEVQAGLFRNQETYAFLEPQAEIRFREFWLPVRGIGGITRANPEAVVRVARGATPGDLVVGLNVSAEVRGGELRVRDGERVVQSEPFQLAPSAFLEKTFGGLSAGTKYTIEVRDGRGRVLLAHTEDRFDYVPDAEIRVGPQPSAAAPPPAQRTDADFVAAGADEELNGRRIGAWDTYAQGLTRFPESLGLLTAQGRLAVDLGRPEEALAPLRGAAARATTDGEVRYYLGLAEARLGRDREARGDLEAAQLLPAWRAAALVELSRLEARAGRRDVALERIRAARAAEPRAASETAAIEVALLRAGGREAEARLALAAALADDPTNAGLRVEATRLGKDDPALWQHLGADPDRVLGLAVDSMALGLWADALSLLDRRYPPPVALQSEPGAVAPQQHPEVVYYRGFCREKTGGDPAPDFAAASRLETRYVFPSRFETRGVLRRALERQPDDPTAHFLLGALELAASRVDDAIREWEAARRLDPRRGVLHRNLGRTLLQVKQDPQAALPVFLEGLEADPTNADVYQGADQALSLLERPAAERVAALERYKDPAQRPSDLVMRLALAKAETGEAPAGEALLRGRFFPREEWGTNVRQVWVELRLQEALGLARGGDKAAALALLDSLGRPVDGYVFTQDGLDAFLGSPRVQLAAGEVAALAGDAARATEHWKRAAVGREGFFRGPAYAALAAARLGDPNASAALRRLEDTLAESRLFLERGTSFPGVVVHAQGVMLRALGREAEAREQFRRALYLPDQQLSHYLSRRALALATPF